MFHLCTELDEIGTVRILIKCFAQLLLNAVPRGERRRIVRLWVWRLAVQAQRVRCSELVHAARTTVATSVTTKIVIKIAASSKLLEMRLCMLRLLLQPTECIFATLCDLAAPACTNKCSRRDAHRPSNNATEKEDAKHPQRRVEGVMARSGLEPAGE